MRVENAPTSRVRLPATIVIPVWNRWDMTKSCLESLRPTLGVRDEVVVVDNGSTDETASRLAGYPWVRVITNEENRGFAVACNQGAAVAGRSVIVFLNNDTVVAGRWMDELVEPFLDDAVGAAGPMSNFVSGPQLARDADYRITPMSEFRAFERAWRQTHAGEIVDVARLVGFCLAVRAAAFQHLGGFDEAFEVGGFEDDDLSSRLTSAGWKLVVARSSFVHHHGHATFDGNDLDWYEVQQDNEKRFNAKKATRRAKAGPLLSAALIVKDEAEMLPACLQSLEGLADEVVVYDTGSTDGTVEIAVAAGATVIRGHWDDDFARARNAALDACSGEWVLSIDADEAVSGEAAALRGLLTIDPMFDVGSVAIDNLGGLRGSTNVVSTHRLPRLFRRQRATWVHRLHEQLQPRSGQPPLREVQIADIRLVHSGYLDDVIAERDKVNRNVRIAEAEVDEGEESAGAILNLARSLMLAERVDDALHQLRRLRPIRDMDPKLRRVALRHGIDALLFIGNPAEALGWIDDLAACSSDQAMARFFEGTARLLLGERERAAELLGDLGEVRDDDGSAFAGRTLVAQHGLVRAAAGDWETAAEALLTVAADPRSHEPIWAALIDAFHRLGRPASELVALVPAERMTTVLAQALAADADAVDAFMEAAWNANPGDARIAAFSVRYAPRLPVERVLEWAARMRAMGVESDCPLISVAEAGHVAPRQRLLAAATASAAFGDLRAGGLVAAIGKDFPAEELHVALVQLDELAPNLLPVFIAAVAATREGAHAVAGILDTLGASEQAAEIRSYHAPDGAGALR